MAVYAVDFDGTLAVTRFPEIIGPRKKVVAAVKMLKASGHKIILWTSRDGKELEAVEHEKRRKQAIKEKREKKKYFLTQKLYGVAILIFTAVAVKILNGDATIALLTVPLGVTLLMSKEMLIINEYYWKCEDNKCNL